MTLSKLDVAIIAFVIGWLSALAYSAWHLQKNYVWHSKERTDQSENRNGTDQSDTAIDVQPTKSGPGEA